MAPMHEHWQPQLEQMLQFFTYDHLPPELAKVSEPFCLLAKTVATTLVGYQAFESLRKLLEAKDCAVRAKVAHDKWVKSCEGL